MNNDNTRFPSGMGLTRYPGSVASRKGGALSNDVYKYMYELHDSAFAAAVCFVHLV